MELDCNWEQLAFLNISDWSLQVNRTFVIGKSRNISAILFLAAFMSLAATASSQAPGRYVVVDFATALVHVLDAQTNVEIAAVHAGAGPSSAVISPNLRIAFVANLNSYYVSVLDLTLGIEIKRLRGIRLAQLAISADGRTVVGTDVEDDGITIINADTLTVSDHISLNGLLGDDPTIEGDLLPDNPVIVGSNVYLNTLQQVGVVNIATHTVTKLASTPASLGLSPLTGTTITATPDGQFVVAIRQGALLVINASTNAIAATLPTAGASTALSISAARNSNLNKSFVYLLSDTGLDRRLSILDFSSQPPNFGAAIGEIILPSTFPFDPNAHIASNANGTRSYLISSGNSRPNIFVVDTSEPNAPILIAETSVGFQLRNIAAAATQNPPPNASSFTPVVTAVTPLITNDAAHSIQISGSGFAPNSQVRVGNLDTIAAQFISQSQLQVTVPQYAAAQKATIIVTNPNQGQNIALQHLSGILNNGLTIANPSTFQPINTIGVVNFGDSTFSMLNTTPGTLVSPGVFAGPRSLGFAITPDGSRAYIENLISPGTISVYNFSTNSIEHRIILDPACSSPGQTRGIVLGPRFATSRLTAFTTCIRHTGGRAFEDLYMIDADPHSATFNAATRIPVGNPQPIITGPLTVSPDGHFAFIADFGELIILDLSNGSSTALSNATLDMPQGFNSNIELSPDGRFLVSVSNDFSSLVILDVGNPTMPTLFARVHGTAPFPGFPRIIGNRLFTFDNNNNIISVFRFNPEQNDFAELATFTVPGITSGIGGPFDVSPDGKLLYLPLREEDSIAVLDINRIIANDPTALLTKLAVGIAPSMAVTSGAPLPANIPVAQITSVFPSTVHQGDQNVALILIGERFQNDSIVSFSNSGIAIASSNLTTPGHIVTIISLSSNAQLGPTDITITNPDGSASVAIGALTVIPTPHFRLLIKDRSDAIELGHFDFIQSGTAPQQVIKLGQEIRISIFPIEASGLEGTSLPVSEFTSDSIDLSPHDSQIFQNRKELFVGKVLIHFPIGDSTVHQLFPIHSGSANAHFTFLNLGQNISVILPLTVVSCDPSAGSNCEPQLGNTHTDFDGLLMKYADRNGVPPQILKAQVAEESGFIPNAFRYEPLSVDFGTLAAPIRGLAFAGLESASVRPWALGQSSDCKTVTVGQGANLDLSSLDATARQKYSLAHDSQGTAICRITNTSQVIRPQSLTPKDVLPSMENIFFTNDSSSSWTKIATNAGSSIRQRFAEYQIDHPPFTAQTVIASSYGLHQILYQTAIAEGYKDQHNIGLPPRGLFVPSVSLDLGTEYLAEQFLSTDAQVASDYIDEQDFLSQFAPSLRGFNAGSADFTVAQGKAACFSNATTADNTMLLRNTAQFRYACTALLDSSFTPVPLH